MNCNLHLRQQRPSERGIGLFEVTLILAAAVLVTAALTPAVLRMIHETRAGIARDELRLLHRAMVGADAEPTYGFVGDIGRLPNTLDELVDGSGLPLFTATDSSGVGYGWNGPYVNRGAEARDAITDPWGMPYEIGVVGPGQLRSAGPNGLPGDADDLVYPPAPVLPWSTLIVSVKGHAGDLIDTDPSGCSVTLSYASNGAYATVVDDTAPFSFADVHRGLHAVTATCPRNDGGTATETAVARVTGSEQQLLELHVALGEAPDAAAATEPATEAGDESGPDPATDSANDRARQR